MKNKIIAFIGAGNMASSLIGGLITDGYDPQKIWASTPKFLEGVNEAGVNITPDNKIAAKNADVIVLAVKPALMKVVAEELAEIVAANKALVISVATGVREVDLCRWLGETTAIVRCMPNTPALIRCGATALYANSQVSTEQKNLAESILRAVGVAVWINEESQLDTVTALSGSGPAYFFLIIEALENAAMELGLTAEMARLLTAQTAVGAARMALESNCSVQELRKKVTSPGGTTERAVHVLEENRVREILTKAVQAARQRAEELAEVFGK
jgi:pyrroline-5-carboxylate reductase